MMTDSIRVDIGAGKQELELLKSMKVGQVRKAQLFPALPAEVEWVCSKSEEFEWQFEGKFMGEKVAVIEIVLVNSSLVLTIKEAAA